MAHNIAKNAVERTSKALLGKVFPSLGKVAGEAAEAIFSAVVRAGSALVTDIAATLDGDATSRKGRQEKVSGWLARYDFAAPVRDHLWSEGVALVGRDTVIAVDSGDISKEFGGAGMEGMEPGYDASRGVTATGPGTVSFSWKASCEDDAPDYKWDHGEFAVDGVVKAYISGETGWTTVSVEVTGPGEHTITWTYLKDDVESEGEDCIWVGGFGWDSAEPYTHTTEVPVPYAWLKANDPDVVDEYEAYEAAAKKTAANEWKVWKCYLVGVSPADETAEFMAKIEMHGESPIVTWDPNLNTNGVVRTYKVYGRETLENGGEWQYPTNSLHRFFKVTVEMP